MRLKIGTNKRPMTVAIKITAFDKIKLCIEAYDFEKEKTYFLTRVKEYKGTFVFKIMLPISPDKLGVNIYNVDKGNLKSGLDKTFKVDYIREQPLKTRITCVNWDKYKLKEFIDFACRFSYNLNYLDAAKTYKSNKGSFYIELLPEIRDDQTGQILNTPARISKSTGKIQVSKKDFETFTVPSRMAILCHEFSHFHINQNPDDESEADINGLMIYLALGFPKIEAFDAFIDVFEGADTDANRKRLEIINNFINDFDTANIYLS